MNNFILDLIKQTVNSDNEKNIDKLYRTIWINTLERFRQNPKEDKISLLLMKKSNNYYTLLYYGDKKNTETVFEMSKSEQSILNAMLVTDGFSIEESTISISREKIISYASKPKDYKMIAAVPEIPINMIDVTKIKQK